MKRHTYGEHETAVSDAGQEYCRRCGRSIEGRCGALIPLDPAEIGDAEPGLYSSAQMNPPSGADCAAVILGHAPPNHR